MVARVPAHVEVAGLIRAVQSAGGFAAVIQKGERDSGTILVVSVENGANMRIFERMPDIDGNRIWVQTKYQDPDNKQEIQNYLDRRAVQDLDMWIVELDIADGERFIELKPATG